MKNGDVVQRDRLWTLLVNIKSLISNETLKVPFGSRSGRSRQANSNCSGVL